MIEAIARRAAAIRGATPPVVLAALDGRTAPAAPAPLRVQGLTGAYGDAPAVFDVSMTAPAGSVTAIMGPNGAGKSTLLKTALGIAPRVAGEARFFGRSLRAVRRRVAYVPQRAAVDWEFPARVVDVARMGLHHELGLLGRMTPALQDRLDAAMAAVEMDAFADRQIGRLSGGQQQRVFLARALVQDADLYLLDEPFAGVDAATEQAMAGVLADLRDAGKAVVCVHHDLATAPAYFDRAVLMNVVKIAEGPVAEALTPETLGAAYEGRLSAAARDRAALDEADAAAAGGGAA